jgi:Fic family protein
VERYYQALQQIGSWFEQNQKISEQRMRKLHAVLCRGKRTRPTPYREGQNVIRDSAGRLIYLPPEAADVPALMAALSGWIHRSWEQVPIPIIAGMAHYQLVTIHPFFDGNGRAARALTTWILYRGGYDLGKFYALEEFYARDLESYYQALVTHPQAPVTAWLAYFLKGMAEVFTQVAEAVREHQTQGAPNVDPLLRALDPRARRVLGLFARQTTIRSADVAGILGVSQRQARELLTAWVQAGWLMVVDPSRRGRKYALAVEYRRFVE